MKTRALLLAALLTLSLALAGCDEMPGKASGSPSPSNSSDDRPSNSNSDNNSSSPSPAADPLTVDLYEEGMDEDGRLGDVLHTIWFNFRINEGYTTSTYGDYTAPEGKQLLVINISMYNPTTWSQPMSDVEFQAQWNDYDDDAFAWPVTTDEPVNDKQVQVDHQLSKEQLPVEYELPIAGTVEGDLIYVVPAELPNGSANKDFSISFVEYFWDDEIEEYEEGDYYVVYFTADAR